MVSNITSGYDLVVVAGYNVSVVGTSEIEQKSHLELW